MENFGNCLYCYMMCVCGESWYINNTRKKNIGVTYLMSGKANNTAQIISFENNIHYLKIYVMFFVYLWMFDILIFFTALPEFQQYFIFSLTVMLLDVLLFYSWWLKEQCERKHIILYWLINSMWKRMCRIWWCLSSVCYFSRPEHVLLCNIVLLQNKV